MKGMSDWSLYELENIAWDEFGNNDDHIVPHHVVEQVNEYVAPGDAHKKPRHVENVGKSADSRGSDTKTVLQRKEETYSHPPMKDENSNILEVSRSHSSENVVLASCDPKFITSASALASQDIRISDECFDDCNVDIDSNIFYSKNPIPQSTVATDGRRSCYLSLDVPPGVTDLDYLENENMDKENDLVYYDLPDIGNFEDIDQMFRNCDATFGQGHMGTGDELSWFSSSSNTIYGSEVTLESGLQSSCSELSPLNSTPGHHGADTNFLPKSDQPMAHHDKPFSLCHQFYADWLDNNADNKGESAPKEQVNDGGSGIKISALTQINGENILKGCKDPDMINVHPKKMESQNSSEENRMQQCADQKLLSSAISTKACSSQHFAMRKHLLGSASSRYMHTFNPHEQTQIGHPTQKIPLTQAIPSIKFEYESNPSSSYEVSDNVRNHAPQCMERLPDQMYKPPTVTPEKLEKLHHRHQLCATMIAEHLHQQASFTSKASVQKRHHGYHHEIGANSEVENISLEPAVEIDSSIVQESSCMTSVCPDDFSVEASSFRQLQDVLDQLDIRTKLRIRDSLYRLARSAKQRLGFTNTNECSRMNNNARGILCTEAPEKCVEFMDAETVTNPIDRSTAHLLFTGLPEPATRSV